MNTSIILGYVALALISWIYSLYRLATRRRRRDPLFGFEEHLLLGGVALLTSALWILFVPVYAVGWAHWAFEQRGHREIDHLWNRGRKPVSIPVRPVQRAA